MKHFFHADFIVAADIGMGSDVILPDFFRSRPCQCLQAQNRIGKIGIEVSVDIAFERNKFYDSVPFDRFGIGFLSGSAGFGRPLETGFASGTTLTCKYL